MKKLIFISLMSCTSCVFAQEEDELNNSLSFQSSFFTDSSPVVGEERSQISSFRLENNVYLDLLDNMKLKIHPMFFYEYESDESTHMDFRELQLLVDGNNWTLRAGLSQEFWGVAESRHVVDTLGQSDFVTDFQGKSKLGQPMIDLSWYFPVGNLSAYYLPVFRTPEYASSDSRPRLPYFVDMDTATYESSKEDEQSDLALRWTQTLGVVDLGLHYFSGTRRAPLLSISETGVAQPRFILIDQGGVDVQVTVDALLLKMEGILQQGDEIENHSEWVAGFEYTFSQVFGSNADIGLLSEYLYDSRGEEADHLFEDDLMLGFRFALNDESSTTFLVTSVSDQDSNGSTFNLDLNTRIGRNFTIGLRGEFWKADKDTDDALSFLRNEDNVKVSLNWFF